MLSNNFLLRESRNREQHCLFCAERERKKYSILLSKGYRKTGRDKRPISKESVAGIEPETPVSVAEHSTLKPPITSTKL